MGQMCFVIIQLIYTLLSQRSPRIHPSRRRQPLAHKWYVHVFYWFGALVAQAEGWIDGAQMSHVLTQSARLAACFCLGSANLVLVVVLTGALRLIY